MLLQSINMNENKSTHSAKKHLNKLEAWLEVYLVKKAPALPKGGREFIVMIAPWLVILGAIFSVPAILAIFGLSAIMSATQYGAVVAVALPPTYYLSIILLIVVVVMELLALPGLFAKKKAGWNLIFYSVLVSAVSSLISMNLGGFIIGTLISLYLLFQVREHYK